MQRRILSTLFIAGVVLLESPWGAAQSEDPIQPAIQATWNNGRMLFANAEPNPPISRTAPPEAPPIDTAMPAPLRSLVHTISTNHGIDPRLVAAVMKVESNYDRWARSPKGALGLMQLIPATGRRFGVEDFFDPAQNIEGGVRYLKFLSEKFGPSNLDLLLAAYNAGENLVERLRAVPPYPETRNYVRKVRNIYQQENGVALVSAAPAAAPAVAEPSAAPRAESPVNIIYRSVDERGVVHFSNTAPPN